MFISLNISDKNNENETFYTIFTNGFLSVMN